MTDPHISYVIGQPHVPSPCGCACFSVSAHAQDKHWTIFLRCHSFLPQRNSHNDEWSTKRKHEDKLKWSFINGPWEWLAWGFLMTAFVFVRLFKTNVMSAFFHLRASNPSFLLWNGAVLEKDRITTRPKLFSLAMYPAARNRKSWFPLSLMHAD